MKLLKVINEVEGIYEVEIETRDEALAFLELVKEDYPFAIMEVKHFKSKVYTLNLYANWGEYVSNVTAGDGEMTTCLECGDCKGVKKPSRNSSIGIGSAPERCFTEEFWAEVVQRKATHFIDSRGQVYHFTNGEGGFCGSRFDVTFEDGEMLKDVGLWHRGTAPKCIAHLFRKAVSKYC